jgi:hypothetical protein
MEEFRTAYGMKSWGNALPSSDKDVDDENLGLFFQTMFERQEIWHRRFVKDEPRPWSQDPFMSNHKFTNVFRELDRHSQWQIKHVLMEPNSRKDLVWKIMLFRIFNCPETFEWIGSQKKSFDGMLPSYDQYNKDEWAELIYGYRETGNNPYTNAYLINSQACPGAKRDWCYTQVVVPSIHSAIPKINKLLLTAKEPKELISYLKTLPAVADFIAHEFYQDFTYAPRYSGVQLMKFDQDDFTNVGPGASIGIRLIFPSLSKGQQIKGIYMLRDMAKEKLAEIGDFKYLDWDSKNNKYKIVTPNEGKITLHQIEMWLCEFQKYWKMKIGEGKQRSVFNPQTKEVYVTKY